MNFMVVFNSNFDPRQSYQISRYGRVECYVFKKVILKGKVWKKLFFENNCRTAFVKDMSCVVWSQNGHKMLEI